MYVLKNMSPGDNQTSDRQKLQNKVVSLVTSMKVLYAQQTSQQISLCLLKDIYVSLIFLSRTFLRDAVGSSTESWEALTSFFLSKDRFLHVFTKILGAGRTLFVKIWNLSSLAYFTLVPINCYRTDAHVDDNYNSVAPVKNSFQGISGS